MTTRYGLALSLLCTCAAVFGSACAGSDPGPGEAASTEAVIDPGDGGQYAPVIDAGDFVATVDNPYFPLAVGSRWVYEGSSDGEAERVEILVTGERRTIMGISATVVRDTVSVGGGIVEDTYDWYAQDQEGNV